ncbi:glycoside hydrolase N-terminal domain-containing protein [Streptomyces sp. Ncost-T10-10d]|uniref:glycoside hydrolase N-terminal domain-containing protein n=1 Tax=Streptomyces sp. Ncost-T10-10d TaxID=1839774 RepID=UPI003520D44B
MKGSAYSKESAEPTLRYDTPAASWERESLPIGGGALGASVYGTLASERLTFNEKTLWTGGPGSAGGYDFGNWTAPRPGALSGVQQRLDTQGALGPDAVAAELGQARRGYGAYQVRRRRHRRARASRPGRLHRRHRMGRGAGPPCGDHGEP